MNKVTVYRFKKWNIIKNVWEVSKSFASLKTIKEIGCVAHEGESAIQVEASTLDENGIHTPKVE